MNDAKYSFLNQLDIDLDVSERLSLLLQRTVDGNNDVYMTPIAKDNGTDFLLREFDKVFNSSRSKMNDTLITLEESNRAKFGPRSISAPWEERKTSLTDSFGVGYNGNFQDITYPSGPISSSRLRPLSISQASILLKPETNSGLPYYTRKSKVKQRLLDDFESVLARRDPCILFTRTQEQRKTRNVWGFPIADTLNEMRFYAPLLEFQKKQNYRSALSGPDSVSVAVTKLIDIVSSRKDWVILSVDFPKYDNSVKSLLQGISFGYIKYLFQKGFHSEIDVIAERFNTIGIITPDGILKGPHGVPSGSTFTNEVDSVTQVLCALRAGVPIEHIQIQGDDGLYALPRTSIERFYESFSIVDLEPTKSKTYESDKFAIYLQNLFHVDYRVNGVINGIYPIYRALNRILFQERWSNFEDYEIKGKDYYSIRTVCICENCKWHPLFEELVKFVLKYDKYSLDISDQGLKRYIQMLSETQGAGEILNQQHGDKIGGIRNFETVKLIQRLG